ncbi:hypothetical protein [Saccharopolyspora kobensis]|nr:hypothetical protein [Saccharopolyspora kobensis]
MRTGAERETGWDGYEGHLTETCEPDAPQLVTNVATMTGTHGTG